MNREHKLKLEDKVRSGDKGSLLVYLKELQSESLDKMKVCQPATLQLHQSQYAVLSKIINLLDHSL